MTARITEMVYRRPIEATDGNVRSSRERTFSAAGGDVGTGTSKIRTIPAIPEGDREGWSFAGSRHSSKKLPHRWRLRERFMVRCNGA
jgi:hypothetical protein